LKILYNKNIIAAQRSQNSKIYKINDGLLGRRHVFLLFFYVCIDFNTCGFGNRRFMEILEEIISQAKAPPDGGAFE
jgi:hypothetical protein